MFNDVIKIRYVRAALRWKPALAKVYIICIYKSVSVPFITHHGFIDTNVTVTLNIYCLPTTIVYVKETAAENL